MVIIGRGAPADIIIPVPQVSARHAEIRHLRDDLYLLTDLGSSNGTFVREQRITSAEMRLSDSIRFGSFKIDLSAYAHLIPPAAGPGETAQAATGPAVIIGRQHPADIVVNADMVSARHAELRHVHDDVYLLTDLGSSNGTFVNGQRIDRAEVRPWDAVSFGSQSIEFASMAARVPRATPAESPPQQPEVASPASDGSAPAEEAEFQAPAPTEPEIPTGSTQSTIRNPWALRRSLAAAAVVMIVALGWGLHSLFAAPYGKQRAALVQRISMMEDTHNQRVAMLGNRDQATVLKGIGELLGEPQKLEEVQGSVENLRASATWFNQILFEPPIEDSWNDEIIESLRTVYSQLSGRYDSLVRTSIGTIRSEIKTASSFNDVCDSARRFDVRSHAVADSVRGLSTTIASAHLAEFDDLRQLVVSPFSTNQEELQLMVVELGAKMVDSLKDDVDERLQTTRGAADAPSAVNASKSLVQWLREARENTAAIANLGIPSKDIATITREIDKAVRQAREIIEWVNHGISAQKRCRDRLGEAIEQAKTANTQLQHLERFASSDQILPVLIHWSSAASLGRRALSDLEVRPPAKLKPLCERIVAPTRDSAGEVVNKIETHLRVVDAKYAEAVQQESTFLGSSARAGARTMDYLGKLAGQTLDRAANSRMGREIGISVKMLILSHKMLYDMMDPDSDPISWAFKYQDDMASLMDETDEVMRMEGPSITGKNTFIEDLVDIAYENSFD